MLASHQSFYVGLENDSVFGLLRLEFCLFLTVLIELCYGESFLVAKLFFDFIQLECSRVNRKDFLTGELFHVLWFVREEEVLHLHVLFAELGS